MTLDSTDCVNYLAANDEYEFYTRIKKA